MTTRTIAALFIAGSAAAIALAPIAAAETTAQTGAQHIAPAPQQCVTTNAGSECTSPGNAQIDDAPPAVNNFPMYGAFPWIL